MSGLPLAADGETLDLTGANTTYVVVVAVIALVALGFAVALRKEVLAARPGHREDAEHRRWRCRRARPRSSPASSGRWRASPCWRSSC